MAFHINPHFFVPITCPVHTNIYIYFPVAKSKSFSQIFSTQPCSPPFLSSQTSFLPPSLPSLFFILMPVLWLYSNRSIWTQRKRKLDFHNGGNKSNACASSERTDGRSWRSCWGFGSVCFRLRPQRCHSHFFILRCDSDSDFCSDTSHICIYFTIKGQCMIINITQVILIYNVNVYINIKI